jgi:hypothetical protein
VRRLALRAEQNRRKVGAARRAFAVRIRSLASSPLVLGGCFVAGFLMMRPTVRQRGATTASHLARRARNAAASIAWLTQLYRQFMKGIGAGNALAARPRTVEAAAYGDPFEEKQ